MIIPLTSSGSESCNRAAGRPGGGGQKEQWQAMGCYSPSTLARLRPVPMVGSHLHSILLIDNALVCQNPSIKTLYSL
ncbi:hypothetical protein CP533_1015 [Ophiocordyceps camponoti-saundersi (nom. inval.)]|nr:hypothetical protein CP533_1015 [Ophiocordyceps camponoti-saundersi (nom. inval.)]